MDFWMIVGRLLLAFVLGGLVGWEREREDKPAGLRTLILVSIGSALFVLVTQVVAASTANADRPPADRRRRCAGGGLPGSRHDFHQPWHGARADHRRRDLGDIGRWGGVRVRRVADRARRDRAHVRRAAAPGAVGGAHRKPLGSHEGAR